MSRYNLKILIVITIFLLLSIITIKLDSFQIKTCDIEPIRNIMQKYNKKCETYFEEKIIKFDDHKIIYSKE